MALFRKKISEKDFINLLIQRVNESSKNNYDVFKNHLKFSRDDDALAYEVFIYSLWIVTVCMPTQNTKIKDLFHHRFCESKDWIKENSFLNEVSIRYEIYNDGFDMFHQKVPELIGGAIVNIMKNGKIQKKELLPKINIIEAHQASMIFANNFKDTVEFMNNIKKRFKVELILDY